MDTLLMNYYEAKFMLIGGAKSMIILTDRMNTIIQNY